MDRPQLEELGPDLLHTSRGRRIFAVGVPFACFALYWIAATLAPRVPPHAAVAAWIVAIGAIAAFSFFSYGSTSHDLVHRNLGLPPHVDDALLSVIEALALRSGHAYRISHLRHHRAFPGAEDREGSPAHHSFLLSLVEGPVYIPRLTLWAWGHATSVERRWIAAESAWILAVIAAAIVSFPVFPALAVYCALVYAASWVFPLALVWIQHDADGKNELFQTRAYRGRIIPALLLHHLYHLEHHLYPKVPAHHWRELSRRLEPFLLRSGVRIIRLP